MLVVGRSQAVAETESCSKLERQKGSVRNGTGLSRFGVMRAVRDFNIFGARFAEEMIGFWASFHRPRFSPKWADVYEFGAY